MVLLDEAAGVPLAAATAADDRVPFPLPGADDALAFTAAAFAEIVATLDDDDDVFWRAGLLEGTTRLLWRTGGVKAMGWGGWFSC